MIDLGQFGPRIGARRPFSRIKVLFDEFPSHRGTSGCFVKGASQIDTRREGKRRKFPKTKRGEKFKGSAAMVVKRRPSGEDRGKLQSGLSSGVRGPWSVVYTYTRGRIERVDRVGNSYDKSVVQCSRDSRAVCSSVKLARIVFIFSCSTGFCTCFLIEQFFTLKNEPPHRSDAFR